MKTEIKIFFTAIMFLTRIRVPAVTNYKPEYLEKSSKYFPLVGLIVGAIGALFFLVINKYLGENLAILTYMLATIWVTGAFHEDGFADVCDAFGGGWTKEKILLIMKDSRLGTYGVTGIIGILATKFMLLQQLPKYAPSFINSPANPLVNYKNFLLILLAAHSTSRLMAVSVIQQYQYVTDAAESKSKPLSKQKLSTTTTMVAIIFALLPFALLPWQFLFVVLPMFVARTMLARYFKKWIGGYTGDCLGTTQQVTEIVFYLSCIIITQYIL
jgi:adenosylcobinamide-GDP ribazoletransferase